jgi:inosine-uridine nucleoside N-ribohydrolase
MESSTSFAKSIVRELKNPSPTGQRLQPANIIVFTDVGRDIDDAALLVILAYLHKISVAKILLIVANVKPSKTRAKAAKFIFEKMGAPDVPVAYGSDGTDKDDKIEDYEFEGIDEPNGDIVEGNTALVDALNAVKERKETCSIIVISSFRDLSNLIKENESLVKNTVSSIFMQGANEVDKATRTIKSLVPDFTAVNNRYDPEATIYVHDWLRNSHIPTYTCTRYSAFRATISSDVFDDAARAGNPVARYIYNAFKAQERIFYRNSSQEDPSKRFLPHLDKKWYTARTSWPEKHGDKLPETFEDVQPFLRMTLYDVVAGLICPLLHYAFMGQIYQPHRQSVEVGNRVADHWIIGRSFGGLSTAALPDINPELLSSLIVELLKEAFLDHNTED